MHLDKVVEGNVFLRNNIVKCCIGIEDEKIVALKKILKGDEHFDFGEKLILPAGIDAHVHFREPGFEKKENFYTGTLAAAYGGISCVIDMPNTQPFVSSKTDFENKLRKISGAANVDYSLYCGLTKATKIDETSSVTNYYKVYFSKSTSANACTFEACKNLVADMNEKKVVAAHCELDSKFLKINCSNLKDYLKARPPEAEALCIKQFINLQPAAKPVQFHICHISSAEAVQIIAGQSNPKISAEVTPHHLFLNVDSNLKKGFGKVNPPLRTAEDQNALWNALKNGTINIIASDHAPHLASEKNVSFEDAESGLPGVETMLPLLLKALKDDKIPVYRFVDATATKPAEIFNLSGKGKIELQHDADLMVVSFRNVQKICTEKLHSLCNWTPYENFEAIFPSHLMIRGNWVIDDFEFVAERTGEFLG